METMLPTPQNPFSCQTMGVSVCVDHAARGLECNAALTCCIWWGWPSVDLPPAWCPEWTGRNHTLDRRLELGMGRRACICKWTQEIFATGDSDSRPEPKKSIINSATSKQLHQAASVFYYQFIFICVYCFDSYYLFFSSLYIYICNLCCCAEPLSPAGLREVYSRGSGRRCKQQHWLCSPLHGHCIHSQRCSRAAQGTRGQTSHSTHSLFKWSNWCYKQRHRGPVSIKGSRENLIALLRVG